MHGLNLSLRYRIVKLASREAKREEKKWNMEQNSASLHVYTS